MSDCVFCKNLPKVIENDLAYALYDINPVSDGHALIIPKRHTSDIFEVTAEENTAMRELLALMRERIIAKYAPDGFNVWMNCGKAAGQVVMHTHIHLIPRYQGKVLHIKDHLKGNIE